MQPDSHKSLSSFPLRLLIFWMLLFQAGRFIFLIYLLLNTPEIREQSWLPAFYHGIRIDFSMTCYLSAIPFLLYCIHTFYTPIKKLIIAFLITELFIVILLVSANIQVYKVWGTLINRRAVTFLADPAAIFASLSGLQIILIVISFIITWFLLFGLLKKWVIDYILPSSKTFKPFLLRFAWLLLLPVGIRGGLQQIPINESAAAWSQDQRLNSLAMNPAWYFGNNLVKSGLNQKNIYKKMPDEEAQKIFHSLMSTGDETTEILNIPKPNIVFIALESWTADLIFPLGGDSNSTPFFNSLTNEGLLFTAVYSTGRRTDQMFPSVLSGFPAQPNHSIIRFPSKTERLPMLSRDLSKEGYETSFYYGGELGFANMRNYLLQGNFKSIISKEDFSNLENLNKWGAHDEYVLNRQAKDLQNMKQPFFSFLLTLSTHEPFDVPGTTEMPSDEPGKFRNAATYTDKCLKEYFSEVKKSGIYKNTLFVLFADHGHLLPKNREYNDPEVYHIPLLITGGALDSALIGQQIKATGNQNDLPATILRQLKLPVNEYGRSNNLLNKKRQDFAYLNMDEGAGWIDRYGTLVWTGKDTVTVKKYTSSSDRPVKERLQYLTAYLQLLFKDFLAN